MKEEILRMEHVYVRRSGKYILQDFKLNVYKGEMVILFGLPGSGVNELGRVLSGEGDVEKGRILLEEEAVDMQKSFYSERYGIHTVYNENNLIPDLSVSDNLFFGWRKNIFSFTVNKKKCDRLAEDIFRQFQIDMDIRGKAKHLTYFEEIIVKLIKAYVKGAKLLIVNDILTAAYGKQQEQLHRVLDKLREDGISIIWMCQRVGFVKDYADRMIVLRNGRNVKTFYGTNYSMKQIVRIASETQLPEPLKLQRRTSSEVMFRAENIQAGRISELSFTVGKGSIVGIWANDSVYLRDAFHVICGERQAESGQMWLEGKQYRPVDNYAAIQQGVDMVDCMWYEKHLIPEMKVVDNLMMKNYWMASGKSIFVSEKRNRFQELQYSEKFGKRADGKLYQLSEQRQRMLVLERCLDSPGKVIAVIEPFAKTNYMATREIGQIFERLLDEGKTLLVFSLNYQDLKYVCEEMVMIGEGRVMDAVPGERTGEIGIEEFYT